MACSQSMLLLLLLMLLLMLLLTATLGDLCAPCRFPPLFQGAARYCWLQAPLLRGDSQQAVRAMPALRMRRYTMR